MENKEINDICLNLLKVDNINLNFNLFSLEGGRNNKVYKVETENRNYLLKKYFYHTNDTRDRLFNEYSFLTYAWNNGIRCIAEPIACDKQNKAGLYSYIDGRRLNKNDSTEINVKKALDFFIDINKFKNSNEAKFLPAGSEACLSFNDYFNSVEWRISRLKTVVNDSDLNKRMLDFLKNKIMPGWENIKMDIIEQIKNLGIKEDDIVEESVKCISPSDFGFHNTMITNDGDLFFIDFEYAGWDDPAKLICDLFLQPEIPVSGKYLELFLVEIYKNHDYDFYKKRIEILFPLQKVKWCCLMLNEFLPVASARRQYSSGEQDFYKKKEIQLQKSFDMYNSIESGKLYD